MSIFISPGLAAAVPPVPARGPMTEDDIEHLYLAIDALFRAGAFDVVDDRLQKTDPPDLGVDGAVALVSITEAAAERLPSRARFVSMTRAWLAHVEPERVDALLAGIE